MSRREDHRRRSNRPSLDLPPPPHLRRQEFNQQPQPPPHFIPRRRRRLQGWCRCGWIGPFSLFTALSNRVGLFCCHTVLLGVATTAAIAGSRFFLWALLLVGTSRSSSSHLIFLPSAAAFRAAPASSTVAAHDGGLFGRPQPRLGIRPNHHQQQQHSSTVGLRFERPLVDYSPRLGVSPQRQSPLPPPHFWDSSSHTKKHTSALFATSSSSSSRKNTSHDSRRNTNNNNNNSVFSESFPWSWHKHWDTLLWQLRGGSSSERGSSGRFGAPRSSPAYTTTTIPQPKQQPTRTIATTTMETSTLKSTSTDVDKVAAMSTLTKPSVHLQLTDPTLARTTDSTATDNGNKNDSNGQDNDNDDDEKNKPTTAAVQQKKPSFVTVHTYRDASTNLTWKGLNVSKRKFLAYLQYRGVIHSNKVDASSTFHGIIETVQQQMLESTTVANAAAPDETSTDSPRSAELIVNMDGAVFDSTNEEQHKQQRIKELDDVRLEWRMLWKSGRLVTDRTELLTVYPSDDTTTATDKNKPSNDQETEAQLRKRGGFDDLLHMYTDRMWAYVKDEANLETCGKAMGVDHRLLAPLGLVEWLESAYGKTETRELCPDKLHALSTEEEQLAKLKHFLEWFRSIFPYFYDRCDSCGASYKDDNAAAVAAASAAEALPSSSTNKDSEESLPPSETPENTENVDNDESEEVATVEEHDEADHQSFVGYIYPDESEVKGLASRTELYQCHVCNHFTRFPRYNSANHIIQSRRGRCGEYSMLLFRILRALRHETRWVVDWSDHVWAEIWLAKQGRWIHLDPCEAAVDENYLYQGWGKQQTFILAFYLPLIAATSTLSTESSLDESGVIHAGNGESSREEFPLIEDMTQSYTREEWSEVCKRREESESHVQACIEKAIHKLQEKKLQLATITTRINAHPQLSTLQQQQ